jgi:hypothetical protein
MEDALVLQDPLGRDENEDLGQRVAVPEQVRVGMEQDVRDRREVGAAELLRRPIGRCVMRGLLRCSASVRLLLTMTAALATTTIVMLMVAPRTLLASSDAAHLQASLNLLNVHIGFSSSKNWISPH